MSEEGVYDPLSASMKHIMLKNGILECQFDSVKQGTCCCGHSVNDHLDCVDCCLAKTKEICICEKYIEKGSKITMPQKQNKLPKKEQEQNKIAIDNKLNNYIEQLAKM